MSIVYAGFAITNISIFLFIKINIKGFIDSISDKIINIKGFTDSISDKIININKSAKLLLCFR